MVENFWYGVIVLVGLVTICADIFISPVLEKRCKRWLRRLEIFVLAFMVSVLFFCAVY